MYFSIAGHAQTQTEKPLNGNVVEEFQLFLRLPAKPDPVTFGEIWRTWRGRILGLHYNIGRWFWLMILVQMDFYKFAQSYKLQSSARRRLFLSAVKIFFSDLSNFKQCSPSMRICGFNCFVYILPFVIPKRENVCFRYKIPSWMKKGGGDSPMPSNRAPNTSPPLGWH